jgi:HSP20 family protein
MTLLVTRPRRSLAMYPAMGLPVSSGAPVDIEETSEAFRIDLDLPGVSPDDVDIELRDSELRVFGSFKERRREGTLRHHARRTGDFEYLVALPGDVDAEAVEAELEGGVLTIVAPKLREQHARRISIQGRTGQGQGQGKGKDADKERQPIENVRPDAPNTPAAQAKQMKEGQSRPGPASQQAGPTGMGSTGQVGRSSMV